MMHLKAQRACILPMLAALHRVVALGLAVAGVQYILASAPAAAQAYEQPPRLRASAILAPSLVQGTDFRVQDEVANDGVINTYAIDSSFGRFQAVSTAKLRQRIAEVHALRHMETIRQSDLYLKAIGQGVRGTLGTVEHTITDPFGTISGSISGIGKAFARTGESLFGSRRSDAEGGQIESLLGVEEIKRKYAADFGVDVYSDNETLQHRLDEIARATFFGKLTYSAALSMVPGGAGVAVTATSVTQTTNEIYRSTTPADLRAMNRQKLKAMGIRDDIAETFVDNSRFSPREQTELVFALERMPPVKGREYFVYAAALTKDHDMAFFRQRQAQMYAGYHATRARIDSFIPFGEFVGARTSQGQIVFNLPVDYVAWTKWMADAVTKVGQYIAGMPGVSGKQVVLTGTLSPYARQQFTAAGWTVIDNAEDLASNR